MNDINDTPNGSDMKISNTIVPKAANVLSVQIQSLEYAPDFGVDLKYFLNSEFEIQNESFKAYLVQRLSESQINVTSVLETIESLYSTYLFSVGDANANVEGLIR